MAAASTSESSLHVYFKCLFCFTTVTLSALFDQQFWNDLKAYCNPHRGRCKCHHTSSRKGFKLNDVAFYHGRTDDTIKATLWVQFHLSWTPLSEWLEKNVSLIISKIFLTTMWRPVFSVKSRTENIHTPRYWRK